MPSVGTFFTPLYLEEAFRHQDGRRRISSRRFVPPSFNDIRLILNSAQVLGIVKKGPLNLVTFDGDVTLYEDGMSLMANNPVTPHILSLLEQGIMIGIVTAAGYTEPRPYEDRLRGLLEAVYRAEQDGHLENPQLIVLGGECNYLLTYSSSTYPSLLSLRPRHQWLLPEMRLWTIDGISALLDAAEAALRQCINNLSLSATVIRKERAVGIVPDGREPNQPKLTREQLEETVLVTQQILETYDTRQGLRPSNAPRIPFCAFNGGTDVFVDIGDKSWGVKCIQSFFGGVQSCETLHIGDQFLSAGANDFKARTACCTAWIASPEETVTLLQEVIQVESMRAENDKPRR